MARGTSNIRSDSEIAGDFAMNAKPPAARPGSVRRNGYTGRLGRGLRQEIFLDCRRAVLVRPTANNRRLKEVAVWRWRGGRPFQRVRPPRIRSRLGSAEQAH